MIKHITIIALFVSIGIMACNQSTEIESSIVPDTVLTSIDTDTIVQPIVADSVTVDSTITE